MNNLDTDELNTELKKKMTTTNMTNMIIPIPIILMRMTIMNTMKMMPHSPAQKKVKKQIAKGLNQPFFYFSVEGGVIICKFLVVWRFMMIFRKIIVLIKTCTLLVFSSCTLFEEDNKQDESPFTQESVDWPSLANTSWPMYKNNPQNTGTHYSGNPVEGINISTNQLEEFGESYSNILIDAEGNYIVTTFMNKSVKKYSFADEMQWSVSFTELISSTPLIRADGNIIAATSTVKAIDNNGNVDWSTNLNDYVIGWLNIDLEGNILCVGSSGTIYSLNNIGDVDWQQSNSFNPNTNNGIVISPDGNQLYTVGNSLVAYSTTDGSLLWNIEIVNSTNNLNSAPAIDNDGNIYFISYSNEMFTLWCVNPSGSIEWTESLIGGDYNKSTAPIITDNGNIVFSIETTLYSFSVSGELQFEALLARPSWGSLCADSDGNIYVASTTINDPQLVSYSNIGEIRFSKSLTNSVDGGLSLSATNLFFMSTNLTGNQVIWIIE